MIMRRLMMLTLALALAVVIPAGACKKTGPGAAKSQPVRTGAGVRLAVSGNTRQLQGELLEVRESHFLIGDGCRLYLAAFARISASRFTDIDPKWERGVPNAAEREELKLLSRFPTGTPEAVITELLKCSGATSPETVEL
jgi:hypothetical protein